MKLIPSVVVLSICFVVNIECILRGTPSDISTAAYLVSIRDNKTNYIAGGAIVSSRLIVTSARVLDGVNNPHDISVLAGSAHLQGQSGTELKIEKITKHADDIAVLRTSEEIIFSAAIQPIRLPPIDVNTDERVPEFAPLRVAGWGKVSNDDRFNWTTEFTTDVYFKLDSRNCNLRLKEINSQFVPKIDGKKLCTEQNLPNQGICSGDIGSPLTTDGLLIGIASWHQTAPSNNSAKYTCTNGYPNVYTNVYAYRDWIAKGDGNVLRAASFVLIAFGATLISMF